MDSRVQNSKLFFFFLTTEMGLGDNDVGLSGMRTLQCCFAQFLCWYSQFDNSRWRTFRYVDLLDICVCRMVSMLIKSIDMTFHAIQSNRQPLYISQTALHSFCVLEDLDSSPLPIFGSLDFLVQIITYLLPFLFRSYVHYVALNKR